MLFYGRRRNKAEKPIPSKIPKISNQLKCSFMFASMISLILSAGY